MNEMNQNKSKFKKGKKLAEGKTKIIYEVKDQPADVIIENKSDITAFDDPKFTKQFEKKAIYATNTTCNVFKLLKQAGLPVAFQEQISSTEFAALKCKMIGLEVIARRCIVPGSSYLKRFPNLKEQVPYRFHRLKIEFNLKTTNGKFIDNYGKTIVDGFDKEKGEEDPLIINPEEENWKLYHPKKPNWDSLANLDKRIDRLRVLDIQARLEEIEILMRKIFLILEGAWNTLGYRFIDLKVEFGLLDDGQLVVADVIDADSWRLTDWQWQDFSKQSFRDGAKLDEVEKKFGIVAELSNQFRIPRQTLVLWRASDKDNFPEYPSLPGIIIEQVTLSGHKSPNKALEKLENLLAEYPDGGVIINIVGRSNGLGPTLAARTSWPVNSVSPSIKRFPNDIWSNFRMPSEVPHPIVNDPDNALSLALNILGQKNPVAYMKRQIKLEELD